MSNQLIDIKEITGKIILKTGLHIGSGGNEMHIGGTDNPVIKTIDNVPYIPGSSIKGKMRSLLEWYIGGVDDGNPLSYKDIEKLNNKEDGKNLLKLFGVSGDNKDEKAKELGIGRLSFSDCALNKDWQEKNEDNLTEVKYENSINRITGTANNPRNTERVPAGAEFDFKLSLKVYDNDNKDALLNFLIKGFKLLEMDALGGSSSRGYGKIKFEFNDKDFEKKVEAEKPFN